MKLCIWHPLCHSTGGLIKLSAAPRTCAFHHETTFWLHVLEGHFCAKKSKLSICRCEEGYLFFLLPFSLVKGMRWLPSTQRRELKIWICGHSLVLVSEALEIRSYWLVKQRSDYDWCSFFAVCVFEVRWWVRMDGVYECLSECIGVGP